MACGAAYTVVILPLHNSLHSQQALHFFLWLRELKALEQEKDSLWLGLHSLDRTRLWYQQRLQDNLSRSTSLGHNMCQEREFSSCMLRCQIQRVNGILGNLMCDACAWISPSLSEPSNSDLEQRWQHCTLTQTVSQQNLHISSLQLERDKLECQCT
ncbi:hypothetical protein ACEWY4_001619 [Coilia grayii]|uniref:Suppressor APC domain-containing protein 1 n=1 Tax=Coilia grayii TaxID=363190 RepID=A0ABD1KU30_9TELE